MDQPSKRKSYRTVNIPIPLYDFIKHLVDSGKLSGGYVSADDFVRDTLRRRLIELGCGDKAV